MKNASLKVRIGAMMAVIISIAMLAVAMLRVTTDISVSLEGAEYRLRGNVQMIEAMLSEFDGQHLNIPPYRVGGYFIGIADTSGRIVFSNRQGYVDRTLTELGMAASVAGLPFGVQFEYTSSVTNDIELAFAGRTADWIIISGVNRNATTPTLAQNIRAVLPVMVGIGLGTALMLFLVFRMLKPLDILTAKANEVANGNTRVNFPKYKYNDEIGMLINSFKSVAQEVSATIDQTQKKSEYIAGGNFYINNAEFSAKGDFQKILDSMDIVSDTFIQYLDELPCGITLFDKDYRMTFLNAHNRAAGFDPAYLVGKSAQEAFPADYADMLKSKFSQSATSGKPEHYPLSTPLPEGGYAHVNYTALAIKDTNGAIVSYINFAFNVTEMIQAKELSEKINTFQSHEAKGIIKHLQDGLGKGLLKFDFTPEPHDQDTAEAAAAYALIGDTMRQSIDFIKGYIDEVNSMLATIAQGNLTVQISREYIGDFASIKNSINNITGSLHRTMGEISAASDHVLSGAKEISSTSQKLADGSSQQAASVEELNTSIEVIRRLIKSNAENAGTASGLSERSTESANTGNESVVQMLEAMEQIKESSNSISGINKVIQDIAFQTNLLALNASVEAARAGEHGKGFAVVADEVRTLAGRSQEAATQTTELIQDSINRVETGSAIAKSTAEALGIIVNNVSEVSHVISNVSASSIEQEDAAQTTTQGIIEIANVAQDNSASSQEAAATAEELTSQAEVLRQLVAFFKL